MAVITQHPKSTLQRTLLGLLLIGALALCGAIWSAWPDVQEPRVPPRHKLPQTSAAEGTSDGLVSPQIAAATPRPSGAMPPARPAGPSLRVGLQAPEVLDEDALRASLSDPRRAHTALDALLHPSDAPPEPALAAALARAQPELWATRLAEVLRTPDLATRRLAFALMNEGGTSSPTLQALASQALISDSDPIALVHALGVVQRQAPSEAAPGERSTLIPSLQTLGISTDPLVRRESLRALAHLGEEAPLIEAASRALSDADPRVRREALEALRDQQLAPDDAARWAAAEAAMAAEAIDAPEQVSRMTSP